MCRTIIFVFLISLVVSLDTINGQFVFTTGAAFKLVAGLGIPVDVKLPGGGLSWFSNVQAIYNLPDNVTYFEPYKIMQKRSVKNTFNRVTIYHALEKYLERLGINGGDCIGKLICEMAGGIYPNSGELFENFLRVLFSPGNDNHIGITKYKKAHQQGLYNETECKVIYQDCEIAENIILSN